MHNQKVGNTPAHKAADERHVAALELLWRVVSETFLTQPATVALHLQPYEREYSLPM